MRSNGELIPPSGFVAGVYSRVDGLRGVHKAPANEIVMGAIGLERNVSRNEQDLLNPIGVNCIRAFPGQGIRIWGARTLSSDARWRYINVRRLFSNIEELILQGTNWIVFEPNDDTLWRQIKRDITAFLTVVWRSGALFGRYPRRGLLRQMRRRDQPQRTARPGLLRHRGRHRARSNRPSLWCSRSVKKKTTMAQPVNNTRR